MGPASPIVVLTISEVAVLGFGVVVVVVVIVLVVVVVTVVVLVVLVVGASVDVVVVGRAVDDAEPASAASVLLPF